MNEFKAQREQMVDEQIAARGVSDTRVLAAMRRVPREKFVPKRQRSMAYLDRPLPIGAEQTISQPYIVALMIEALNLRGGEKVLEVGAGSGYAAAVLAELAGDVYAVERIAQLADGARVQLLDAGYNNVHVLHDDGSNGWRANAPYDAILVSAGAPHVPQPLKSQLAVGGRLVIPVGSDVRAQQLLRVTRQSQDQFDREVLAAVRFVPLIGDEAWQGD